MEITRKEGGKIEHMCLTDWFKDEYKLAMPVEATNEFDERGQPVVNVKLVLLVREVRWCSMCGEVTRTEWKEAEYEDEREREVLK